MGPQNVMLLVLAAPCALSQTLPALRLRGVFAMNIDSGSNPGKAVHLYATQDIADLSSYSIGIANNGGGTDGSEFSLSGAAAAGDNIIVVRESLTPLVTSHLCSSQFQRQIIGSSKVSQNGDDAIELFHDTGSGPQLVDTFGDNSVDGTGQPWEYSQSWAYRQTLSSSGTFDVRCQPCSPVADICGVVASRLSARRVALWGRWPSGPSAGWAAPRPSASTPSPRSRPTARTRCAQSHCHQHHRCRRRLRLLPGSELWSSLVGKSPSLALCCMGTSGALST